MSRELVAQAEAKQATPSGHWFGYEIFDVNGTFVLKIHTSTYDGIQRTSHWACPEVAMKSLTLDGALSEAAERTAAYARTVLGQAAANRP